MPLTAWVKRLERRPREAYHGTVHVDAGNVRRPVQQAQRREHAGANADVEHARLPLLFGLKLLYAFFDSLTVLHVAIFIVEHAQEVFGEPVLGRVVRPAALRRTHDALACSRSMNRSTPLTDREAR